MLCSRYHPGVCHILIRVKSRVSTVGLRNLGLQHPGAFATAIPDVIAHDLAALGVHRHPNPLLVRLVLDEARHFVGFDFEALDHDVRIARDRLDMGMIGQRFKIIDNKAREPLEFAPHSAMNAV